MRTSKSSTGSAASQCEAHQKGEITDGLDFLKRIRATISQTILTVEEDVQESDMNVGNVN